MQPVANLSTIIDGYDALLLDLWGVIHDGSQLYPGVQETLSQLRNQQKKIIFISNAPRRAEKAAAVLMQLGIQKETYDHIITSGEAGYQWLAAGKAPWGKRYFFIGPLKDADVLDGLDLQRVDDLNQADFLLNVGFGSEEQSADDVLPLLRAAKNAGLPMLCLNPDFEVVKISGEHFPCAGVIAADYEKLGGVVRYFGKPFPEVYEICMRWLGLPKSRVLAIGDGIVTDIAGAVRFGLDSVLVTGGIAKKESPEAIEAACRTLNALPKYVTPSLRW